MVWILNLFSILIWFGFKNWFWNWIWNWLPFEFGLLQIGVSYGFGSKIGSTLNFLLKIYLKKLVYFKMTSVKF